MDLSTVNDLTELKAMAYDQLVQKEQADVNLQAVNARINQVKAQPLAEANLPDDTTEPADSTEEITIPDPTE
jgi:hypothetical protein